MSRNKLTDTQLVLLSAAAQREDGAIDPAVGPKAGFAKKAIGKLLTASPRGFFSCPSALPSVPLAPVLPLR